ncbi:glycosyltransferase family 4 protein [Pseudoalteromonas ruthenica]|uniref:Glycosyl transferase family 1 n=2 Tax=Pseudoalteromonas TaxID=53246 RepID=A0A0F4PHR1_9GAMM|nr:glycosyltransferase family 4 protein [Pseudoalteromonas ruthenica]QFU03779.1 putative glycosyl transferase [Pseudoalteromonas sp. THAF3]KJY95020.1 glycosyl transferase family 1 [Pseudoalteromonas ruthenica]KJY98701.1 glycosyl transferase family 1 [Pseudoalteromonas ruthenica]TLX51315.1 glycosyltransferase WbuB [Pseudoalteromonas ruthenica]TMO86993.1 glycosyltransferase WbuB [Pseudoalteromonas ruthenica]
MHILYLHQYFATPKSNGGTRSYEMARRLVQDGYTVEFVTSSAFLNEVYEFKRGWNELHIEGIKLHVYHLPYSNTDSFVARILKFLRFSSVSIFKSFSIKTDLVFATSTPLTIGLPALLLKKLKKLPLVFEVRDLWPELPVAVGVIKNPLLIKLLKWFEACIYRNSRRVVALSPGMQAGIVRTGYPESKTTCIPNSCDVSLFNIPNQEGVAYKQQKLSFVGERKLIIYAGTFGLINDVEYIAHLAHAARSYDDLCFVAIGNGMCKADVIAKAKELGVYENNLYILDPIAKQEVIKLYSAADLSLSLFGPVPEMWNNSANKLFDALASQTPIAINYAGWQKDFIEESGCGLVLNNDLKDSVDKIESFLANSEKYTSAVKACQDLSHGQFSRDNLYEKFKKTIEDAYSEHD